METELIQPITKAILTIMWSTLVGCVGGYAFISLIKTLLYKLIPTQPLQHTARVTSEGISFEATGQTTDECVKVIGDLMGVEIQYSKMKQGKDMKQENQIAG